VLWCNNKLLSARLFEWHEKFNFHGEWSVGVVVSMSDLIATRSRVQVLLGGGNLHILQRNQISHCFQENYVFSVGAYLFRSLSFFLDLNNGIALVAYFLLFSGS